MFGPVDTRMPNEVEAHVRSIHRALFPAADPSFIALAFDWASQCFNGRYADYQAIDARYHDFEHTLQGTLCLARLLYGWHEAEAEAEPAGGGGGGRVPLAERQFELALLGILFHDSGYLKKRADLEGTGAKYTYIHVARSADFAASFLAGKGYSTDDIASIRHMISCTGVNADLASIPFRDATERRLGYALATADLLGQMAAHDYVDKLPILFQEFAEAQGQRIGAAGGRRVYRTVDELLTNTRAFWDDYVRPKIERDFEGMYRYLNDPYPDGPNSYLQRIEQNLHRLDEKIRRQCPPPADRPAP